MLWTSQNQNNLTVERMVERIMVAGEVSRKQYIQLTNALLSEDKVTEEERRQINQIFDRIQFGRIKIVD